jgi:protein-S-isoprenylcysteine O-methyltransferase Ste14
VIARALIAFLLLPGVVAFLVPLWLFRPADRMYPNAGGWILLSIGLAMLLWCVREFYVMGKGTLAPWSPPRHLVTSGPYCWSRNPMYIAVVLILAGWAVGFQSRGLAEYAIVMAVAFHLRVVFGEEPWLARRHGDEWSRYKNQVRRWL